MTGNAKKRGADAAASFHASFYDKKSFLLNYSRLPLSTTQLL